MKLEINSIIADIFRYCCAFFLNSFRILTRSCWKGNKKTLCSQTQRQTMMEFMGLKNDISTNICYAYYDARFIHGQTTKHFNIHFFFTSWKTLKYRLTNPLIDILAAFFYVAKYSQSVQWSVNGIALKINGFLRRKIWFYFMPLTCA